MPPLDSGSSGRQVCNSSPHALPCRCCSTLWRRYGPVFLLAAATLLLSADLTRHCLQVRQRSAASCIHATPRHSCVRVLCCSQPASAPCAARTGQGRAHARQRQRQRRGMLLLPLGCVMGSCFKAGRQSPPPPHHTPPPPPRCPVAWCMVVSGCGRMGRPQLLHVPRGLRPRARPARLCVPVAHGLAVQHPLHLLRLRAHDLG